MTGLPFTAFWAGRASSHNEAVVKRVLEQLRNSPEAHRKLASTINANVKFPGFNKNSSIAPIPHLAKPVMRQLDFSNDLAAAIFEAWAKSQRRLHDVVAKRLAISGIPVDYPDFAGGGFRGFWHADDWRREHDEILGIHNEFDSNDVLLMLCYLTGKAPSDAGNTNGETAPEELNMLNPDVVSQWKRTLDSLPPDSPMWDEEIPNFIAWLSSLANEKKTEREASIRWREIISELSAPGPIAEQLNSAGVSAVAWAEEEFASPQNAPDALQTAVELKTVVEDLVEHLAGNSNLGQVLEFYERIKILRAELDTILASPRPPDDEPPKPKIEPSGGKSASLDISGAAPRQDAVVASESAEDDNAASAASDKDARGENVGDLSKAEPGDEKSDKDVPSVGPPIGDSSDDGGDGAETTESEGGEGAPPEDPGIDPKGADDDRELETAMWEMAGEGDLSGAYWIACSLEAQRREMPALSHLFAAAQGARWLSPNSDAYAEDLFSVVADHDAPEKNDIQKLLGLGAALQASVTKPETNLAAWLIPPESCRRLERVAAPIRDFKDFGIPARLEDIDAQDGIAGLRKSIDEASADAGEWLDAPHVHNYPPAMAVFRNLRKDGAVREMLAPVAKNDQTRKEWVKAVAEDLKQETSAVDAINKVHQNIAAGGSSSKQSPIVSHARSWLVGKIQEAAGKAIHWCNLVERENKSAVGGNDWWMKQVSDLRDGINANSRDAFAELDELRSDSRDAAVSAVAGCVAMSLARLLEYLRLPIPESAVAPAVPAVVEHMDAIAASRPDRLETAMGRRLIWTPAARLGGDCLPAPGNLAEMGRLLLENRRGPVTLREALKRRAEDHQDYRFYDVMSVRLSKNCRADLEAARAKSRKASEDALTQHAASARHDLHQAVRDGILEYDALEWESSNSIIERFISDANAELNRNANVDDFQTAHEEIKTVQDLLGEMRDKKRAELSAEWDRLLDSARERSDIGEYATQTWETKFSQADSQGEIRVMEVCAARLGNCLNSNERLLPADQYDSSPRGAFEEYDGFLKGILDPKERARGSGGLKALVNA